MQPDATPNVADRPAEFDKRLLQYMPFIRKMAYRLEKNAQDREDLINETVAVILHRWHSYRNDGSFTGWIAFNMRERAGAMRKKRESLSYTEVSYDDPHGIDYSNSVVSTQATQETIVELCQIMRAMPDGRSGDILIRLASGDTGEEIGCDYGLSRERIRQIGCAARQALRKRLDSDQLRKMHQSATVTENYARSAA